MKPYLRIPSSANHVPSCSTGASALKDYRIFPYLITLRALLKLQIDICTHCDDPDMLLLYKTGQEKERLTLQCPISSRLPLFMIFSYRFLICSIYYDF
jgi:hypothetical protein